MVKRLIEPGDLSALNLILDRDPSLAAIVIGKLEAVNMALGGQAAPVTQPEAPKVQATPETPRPPVQAQGIGQSQTADFEAKILDWFKANTGKHALSKVREALGVAQTSKPFKSAVQNLIAQKKIKGSGKRGKGAEYWLG